MILQYASYENYFHLSPYTISSHVVIFRQEQVAAEDMSFRKLAVIEFLVKAEPPALFLSEYGDE